MRNWLRGTATAGDDVAVLRTWVEQLTQDNMRLRLSQQRPSSPGQYADDLRELGAQLSALSTASAADAEDEALHALAEATTIRRSVVDVLVRLQVVAAQLERQLAAELPHAEIDRRVLNGRSGHPGLRAADHTDSRGDEATVPAESAQLTSAGAASAEVLVEMAHMLDLDQSRQGASISQPTGQAVA